MAEANNITNFEVVLVEPEDSLNIGATLRAMMSLGFSRISLIKPKEFNVEKVAVTACWASEMIQSIKVYDNFKDALAQFEDVIGLSARAGKNRSGPTDLFAWADETALAPTKNTAILFGPESTGLREEHVEECRCLVRIPSTDENPSYNLAQAVLLVLFELNRKSWTSNKAVEQPNWGDFQQLDRIVDSTLRLSGFYRDGTPEPVPGLVKQLFRRMSPNKREMAILLGLFGRIERHFGHTNKAK